MKIDWHSHVSPPEINEENRTPQMEIGHSLEVHDAAGVDLVVVTNAMHYVKDLDADRTLDAVRRSDDFLADIARTHPERTICFTTTIPNDDDRYLSQLETAVKEMGLRGVFIHSSHQGHYPDEGRARPFWELCRALDLPVFIHAPSSTFGEECMSMYRLISSLNRPFDECLAIARLIVSGMLERMPGLKIVGAHVGGGISSVIGRMDYAYELGDYVHFLGPYEPVNITKKPSEYLKDIYMDTACYHFPALVAALMTVGPDRLLFGTDAPALVPLLPGCVDLVNQLDIPEEQRDRIFWGNAAQLLNLDLDSLPTARV